uniref:Uncharacterized protein n=1 Tax=Podoviridae sp. ctTZV6 TaxID=2826556 RepID=A0A8S5NCG4_9CAUD|nr:MAG TPA: hypothetical protein [Podoviridae sp. ctTZV6]
MSGINISYLVLASFVVWVVLSVYQIYQHCKGNFRYYKVSNRYIYFMLLLVIMLITWFILVNMQIDELLEVRNVKY